MLDSPIFKTLLLFALQGVGLVCAAQPLRVCDDEAGWPPYTYVDPKSPQSVVGASVEFIFDILKRGGYQPTITLLPWKRCLMELEAGKYAMALNATYSPERAQKYLLSKPYYSMHSALFYRTSKFPVPPKITTVADMKSYKYCGLAGYNYTMYDIPPAQLDSGARDDKSRFEKLRLDRCDFVLGDLEILKAFAMMGQLDLSGISQMPIPDAKAKEFHVLLSKATGTGDQLTRLIDEGISSGKADKSYDKIFKKYGL